MRSILFIVIGLVLTVGLSMANSKSSFAVNLYKTAASKENFVISPFSVETCLGLAYMAASGETASEVGKALHVESLTRNDVGQKYAKILGSQNKNILQIANRIYVNKQYTLSKEFAKFTKDNFDSEAKSLDFSQSTKAEGEINQWVEERTHDKIKNLLAPGTIDSDTSAILVNAIYFKGLWNSPFPSTNNRNMTFHGSNGDKQVEFMYDEERFAYGEFEDLQASAVQMDYKDGNYKMLILLPNDKNGLTELTNKINNYDLSKVPGNLVQQKIDIYIPKFKTESEKELIPDLKTLGIKTMFSDNAEFSNLFEAGAPAVRISKVFHKAVVSVDENGSEAAAATYFKAYPMSLNLNQKTFKADHPFLWFIWDQEVIYFMGQVTSF